MKKADFVRMLCDKINSLNGKNGFKFEILNRTLKDGKLFITLKGKKTKDFIISNEGDTFILKLGEKQYFMLAEDLVMELLIRVNGGPEPGLRHKDWNKELFSHLEELAAC